MSPAPATPGATATATAGDLHLTGLDGVTTVRTATFQKAQLLLGQTVTLNDIAAISGPPGCGKTLAVDHFLHHHPTMADRDWHWLQMPHQPSIKEVIQRLMDTLGIRFNRRATVYELVEDLVPVLNSSHRVVVIDEAHQLKAGGLQQLRYLHDRGHWSWTLVLVGSDVDRTLAGAAELSSRVSAWVRFEPMTTSTLLKALTQWHPLMAQMDPALLLQIDQKHARGSWRLWAQFLRALLDVLSTRPAGTVPDAKLVSAALARANRR